jgi:CubicO group peptidase (beta-lactamase class C family)
VALAGAAALLSCARPRGAPPDVAVEGGPVVSADPVQAPVAPGRRALLDSVARVLDRAVADSAFPGAYAAVGTAAGVLAEYGAGRIDWAADAPRPTRARSGTSRRSPRSWATTSAVMQLVGDGRVRSTRRSQRYLPDWTGPNKGRATVRHLLTHSSGLPAWRPLYKEATSPESALALVLATGLDTLPGARYVYSDLNFILLGTIVARVTGEPLDAYGARHVFAPLGMRDTRYAPDPRDRARTAPTEFDPWRQRHLRGEVHDENAYALGRVAGHAGLFSTGADLARLARAYLTAGSLDGRPVFDGRTLAEFTRVQDTTVSRRALGWETPTGGNSAGHYLSRRAFGHTGFTGTSLWMDPDRGVFVLLLTNRVNPTRMNTRIGRVRVALADAAMQALGTPPAFPSPSPASAR